MRPYVTVEQAFIGLPALRAGESAELTNHQAPNHQQSTVDRISSTDWGEPLFDSWTEKVRLHPDAVAPTLKAGKRANYHFGHPFDARGLTVRERARLMSFTDDFVFHGGVVAGRTLSGNAVPPRVAEALAEVVV